MSEQLLKLIITAFPQLEGIIYHVLLDLLYTEPHPTLHETAPNVVVQSNYINMEREITVINTYLWCGMISPFINRFFSFPYTAA